MINKKCDTCSPWYRRYQEYSTVQYSTAVLSRVSLHLLFLRLLLLLLRSLSVNDPPPKNVTTVNSFLSSYPNLPLNYGPYCPTDRPPFWDVIPVHRYASICVMRETWLVSFRHYRTVVKCGTVHNVHAGHCHSHHHDEEVNSVDGGCRIVN